MFDVYHTSLHYNAKTVKNKYCTHAGSFALCLKAFNRSRSVVHHWLCREARPMIACRCGVLHTGMVFVVCADSGKGYVTQWLPTAQWCTGEHTQATAVLLYYTECKYYYNSSSKTANRSCHQLHVRNTIIIVNAMGIGARRVAASTPRTAVVRVRMVR